MKVKDEVYFGDVFVPTNSKNGDKHEAEYRKKQNAKLTNQRQCRLALIGGIFI